MIIEIINRIQKNSECQVSPPQGQPSTPSGCKIPEDLKVFYEKCGGALLFSKSDYHWRILAPREIKNAVLTILDETTENPELKDLYLIADDGNGDYLAINLSQDCNGYVVDAFHETFGENGDTPIIALSFTELLNRIYDDSGEYPYWLKDKANVYTDWFIRDR